MGSSVLFPYRGPDEPSEPWMVEADPDPPVCVGTVRVRRHRELLGILLDRVKNDRHPSVTELHLIEELMGPEERAVYARVLLEKIRRERWPSLQTIRRVMQLG